MKKLSLLFMFLFLTMLTPGQSLSQAPQTPSPTQGQSITNTLQIPACEEGRIELSEKPEVCPCCNETPIATILYGLPYFSDEVKRQIADKELYLGGCPFSAEAPTWICTFCKRTFFKN